MAAQIVFVLGIACLAAVITSSACLSSLASLDVARVMSGEVWRIFTGHLSHLTWRQYAVDASAFVILYAAWGRKTGFLSSAMLIAVSALTVSFVVILSGIHQVYGGLSGLTYAGWSALILRSILERPRHYAAYIAGLLFLLYFLFGEGAATGAIHMAGEAHMAGIVTGICFVVIGRVNANRNLHLT